MRSLTMTQDNDTSKHVTTSSVHSPSSGPQIPVPSVKSGRLEPGKVVQWNTSNLGLRLAADLTSAATASALIAPIISVIDRLVLNRFHIDLYN